MTYNFISRLLDHALAFTRRVLRDQRGFASFWYGRGVQASILGAGITPTVNYLSDTMNVGLSTSTHVPNKDDTYLDDAGADDFIDGELSGGNYVRKTLASKTITYNAASDRVEFDAADVTWTAINAGTAAQATVFDSTPTTDNSRRVLMNVDTGGFPVVTNGGDLTIQWNTAGLGVATV